MHKKYQILFHLTIGCVLFALGSGIHTVSAEDAAVSTAVKLPFSVYEDRGSAGNHYIPSGWMGNAKATKMDDGCTVNPHGGKTCLKVEYGATDNWAGIVWQDPINDWGDLAGGSNITGAKKLKFWARGEKGEEVVSFKFGILGSDKKFSDSANGEMTDVKLTKEWTEYSFDLAGKDLTRIKTGFCWSLAGQASPVVFYLDDIRFE